MRRGLLVLNWAMIPTAIGLLSLLALTLMGWPGGTPDPSGGRAGAGEAALHPASRQARGWLGWASSVEWRPFTNSSNPFFTLAIRSAPPPQPPTPPPATKKVEMTYRGFFETSARVRRAVVQVAENQIIVGKGDKILADFVVVDIELGHLNATNVAGIAVKLDFSKTVPIEVPSK